MSTAQRILNLLNRDELSVSELASRLGVSRNSTHVHITKLEAAGAVEKIRREAGNRVGKPAYRYRTAAQHEDAFSTAYRPVFSGLVEVIGDRLSKKDRLGLLNDTGRALAKSTGLSPTSDFDSDLRRAIDAVNELGAMAERSSAERTPTVRCHTCPIGTLVHKEPTMCNLVASFFSEATGTPVTVQCRRDRTVVCAFSFGEDDS